MNKSQLIQLARQLRKDQTEAEKKLWFYLRNRKFKGVKFLRQRPLIYGNSSERLLFYIPDFYSAEKKLVIELDGGIHNNQLEYDQNRDAVLKGLGLKVLRFKNEDLEDLSPVLDKIEESIDGK